MDRFDCAVTWLGLRAPSPLRPAPVASTRPCPTDRAFDNRANVATLPAKDHYAQSEPYQCDTTRQQRNGMLLEGNKQASQKQRRFVECRSIRVPQFVNCTQVVCIARESISRPVRAASISTCSHLTNLLRVSREEDWQLAAEGTGKQTTSTAGVYRAEDAARHRLPEARRDHRSVTTPCRPGH